MCSFSDYIGFNTLKTIKDYRSMTTIDYNISIQLFLKNSSQLFTIEEHGINHTASNR
jgi:hypothetical protein